LSVFQDGVRLNEFLGDTMNWDLVPQDAIASVEVVPGAEPRHARNTLGGAILFDTKRGFTNAGTRAEASYGSFGRRRGLVETGGSRGAFDYFALGNFLHEDGFRDFSESRVNQAFAEVGWRDGNHDVTLNYTLARNNLRGNAFAPESFLELDRGSVYTQPDIFRPDLDLVILRGTRKFGAQSSVDARFHFRNLDFKQSNGDAGEEAAAEEPGMEEEPADGPLPGVLRITRGLQRRFGGAVDARYASRLFGGENDLSAGVEVDRGEADLSLAEQDGFLNDDRAVVASGPSRIRTDVSSDGVAIGVYVSDSFSPFPWATVTPAARYDRQHLAIDDHLGAASGDHVFERVNPSIGLTLRPEPRLNLFARYGESFRAPTAVELTCASEEAPCPLPVAFVEDPPLEKVRARSVEAGMRAQPLETLRVKLAYFRTDLDGDILFVTRTRALGFFRNVGTTRRQGVEAFFDGSLGRVRWFANYSFTRAT
ncbi:MAG: TonB-dependent receptor, partial [Candidatus Binatia bacterium]